MAATPSDSAAPVEIHATGTFTPVRGDDITSLTVNLSLGAPAAEGEDASKAARPRLMIYVVDKSGSMGGVMYFCKEAIKTSAKAAYQEGITCGTVMYATRASSGVYGSYDKLAQKSLSCLIADGATNFVAAFDGVKDCITEFSRQHKKTAFDVVIMFLTDGQETVNSEAVLNKKLENLDEIFRPAVVVDNGGTTIVHCVGLTSEHNVQLLSQLTNAGTVPGTFQYARNRDELGVALQTVSSMAGDVSGTLTLDGLRVLNPTPADFAGFSMPALTQTHTFQLWVEGGGNRDTIEGVIDVDGNSTKFVAELDESADQMALLCNLTQFKVDQLSKDCVASASKPSEAELEAIRARFETLDNAVTDMTVFIYQIKKSEARRNAMQAFQGLKDQMASLSTFIRNLSTSSVSNDDVARLLALSYQTKFTRKAAQKKMDSRVAANIEHEKERKGKIEAAVAAADVPALSAAVPDDDKSRDLFSCYLSACDWVEAIENEDAVCASLCMSRNETAIMEPSHVRVNSFNDAPITYQSFFDAVEFKLVNTDTAPEDVHGGYDIGNKTSAVVSAMAAGHLNALFPLYIHPSHWGVAREVLYPCLGFDTTADPFGYAGRQRVTVPFVILTALTREMQSNTSGVTAHRLQLFVQLLRTVYEVIKETGDTDDVITSLTNYYEEAADRLPENMASSNVLLGSALLFFDRVEEGDSGDLVLVVLEEEVRRYFNRKLKGCLDADELELLKHALNITTADASAAATAMSGGDAKPDPVDVCTQAVMEAVSAREAARKRKNKRRNEKRYAGNNPYATGSGVGDSNNDDGGDGGESGGKGKGPAGKFVAQFTTESPTPEMTSLINEVEGAVKWVCETLIGWKAAYDAWSGFVTAKGGTEAVWAELDANNGVLPEEEATLLQTAIRTGLDACEGEPSIDNVLEAAGIDPNFRTTIAMITQAVRHRLTATRRDAGYTDVFDDEDRDRYLNGSYNIVIKKAAAEFLGNQAEEELKAAVAAYVGCGSVEDAVGILRSEIVRSSGPEFQAVVEGLINSPADAPLPLYKLELLVRGVWYTEVDGKRVTVRVLNGDGGDNFDRIVSWRPGASKRKQLKKAFTREGSEGVGKKAHYWNALFAEKHYNQ